MRARVSRRVAVALGLACLLTTATLLWAEGVHLCRADLEGPALYRKIPAEGTTERTVMWRGRESRFPLKTCLLCDNPLPDNGKGGPEFTLEGSVIRVCGPECQAKLREMGEGRLHDLQEKLAVSVIQRDRADYPLNTCPVTGRKLAGDADAVDQVYDNTLVRLADDDAVDEFRKDPDGYVLTVRLARTLAKQRSLPGRTGNAGR